MQLKITDRNGNRFECDAVGGVGVVSIRLPFFGAVFFEVKEIQAFIKQLKTLCDDATS